MEEERLEKRRQEFKIGVEKFRKAQRELQMEEKRFRAKRLPMEKALREEAGRGGGVEAVCHLLNEGVNVNAKSQGGFTALHGAAEEGDVEVLHLLLNEGANINAANIYGVRALNIAVINDHVEVVELLLQAGADINAKDENGETALYNTVFEDNELMRHLLLQKGADTNAATTTGLTALHLAASKARPDTVRLLWVYGADINATDDDDEDEELAHETALDVAKRLLQLGGSHDDVPNARRAEVVRILQWFKSMQPTKVTSLQNGCKISIIRRMSIMGRNLKDCVKQLEYPQLLKNFITDGEACG